MRSPGWSQTSLAVGLRGVGARAVKIRGELSRERRGGRVVPGVSVIQEVRELIRIRGQVVVLPKEDPTRLGRAVVLVVLIGGRPQRAPARVAVLGGGEELCVDATPVRGAQDRPAVHLP